MQIITAGSRPTKKASSEYFKGVVWQDPIIEAAEPARVRALKVTFEPGQGDEMHQHGVMSIYGVTGGKLQNTSPDGTLREMEVPDGFVGHRNTVTTHQMKNIGDTTVKVILVEHKKLGAPEA